MDAQQLRKALYDFFKFNPKDFIVKGSATGYLVELARSLVGREKEQYLPPWSCYITEKVPDNVTLKINPVSTLMQTYDYHSTWNNTTWKDAWTHVNITNFGDEFLLTSADQCIWMEVVFSAGDIASVIIRDGVPGSAGLWNADLRYVSSSNALSSGGSFTWYQLLAYFKPSGSGDGGSEVDAVFSGVNYKLMCPTTTHLMQGLIVNNISYNTSDYYYAVVPWHGCWFPTS